MITQLIGAVLNCVLDPIMIFGCWAVPPLVPRAQRLPQSCLKSSLWGLASSSTSNSTRYIHIPDAASELQRTILREIVRIGLPAALQQSLMSVLTIGFNRILMPFSQTAVGFYGIYYKLQTFYLCPSTV